MENIDAIIAGAGIWGCTVARRLDEIQAAILRVKLRHLDASSRRPYQST